MKATKEKETKGELKIIRKNKQLLDKEVQRRHFLMGFFRVATALMEINFGNFQTSYHASFFCFRCQNDLVQKISFWTVVEILQ